jgi:hypothetical protein
MPTIVTIGIGHVRVSVYGDRCDTDDLVRIPSLESTYDDVADEAVSNWSTRVDFTSHLRLYSLKP